MDEALDAYRGVLGRRLRNAIDEDVRRLLAEPFVTWECVESFGDTWRGAAEDVFVNGGIDSRMRNALVAHVELSAAFVVVVRPVSGAPRSRPAASSGASVFT
jgi:hypothetical protein